MAQKTPANWRNDKQLAAVVRALCRVAGTAVCFVEECDDGDARIVFTGGPHGDHSLYLSVSSAQRVVAHWKGYAENAGMDPARTVNSVTYFDGDGNRGLARFTVVTGRGARGRWYGCHIRKDGTSTAEFPLLCAPGEKLNGFVTTYWR